MGKEMVLYGALVFAFTFIFRIGLELSKKNEHAESIFENVLCILLAVEYAKLISGV